MLNYLRKRRTMVTSDYNDTKRQVNFSAIYTSHLVKDQLNLESNANYLCSKEIFHTSIGQLSFTRVCVTASSQVSRTLFSILTTFDNAVVWIFSTQPLTSKSSNTSTNPLGIAPNESITIGITVTYMCHGFFFSFHYLLISVYSRPGRQNLLFGRFSVFCFFFVCLLTVTRSGRLAKIRRSVCILKSKKNVCVSFSRTDSGLCIYHLFAWSKVYFLQSSK